MADSSAQSVCWGTVALFSSITLLTVIGVPLFAYYYEYSLLDWILLAVLYVVTGMGITGGYHRLITHRSFESRRWIKACLLVAGGWAVQNSALRWCADHIRHHAHTDEDADPYNATKGFWHSHVGWLFVDTPYRDDRFTAKLRADPLIMWQHRYYWMIAASGLLLPFAAGYVNGGFTGGLGCFLLAGLLRTVLVLNSTFTINPSAT